MAGEALDSSWPLPKFYFRLRFGFLDIAFFQEVLGLDFEDQLQDFRHNNTPIFSSINNLKNEDKGNVVLKKSMDVNNKNFKEWYEKIKMNTNYKETAVIELLEESGNPIMTWTLRNARPVKISALDSDSAVKGIAIETIELSHEGFTITNN